MKNEFSKRWETETGKILRQKVLSALSSQQSLESIAELTKVEGRWDLRGIIVLPNLKIKSIRNYNTPDKVFRIKNTTLDCVDFSYADLSYTYIVKSTFKDCLFVSSKLNNINVIASHFIDSSFVQCNLKDSFLNSNIGRESGSYQNVSFEKCDLSKSHFCFPIIDACEFIICNLLEVNFDGSRFKDCTFSGALDYVFFRRYAKYANESVWGIFNKVNPKEYPNEMKNVDFSAAKMTGVSFTEGIDLHYCKFPVSDKYIFIKNLRALFSVVVKILEESWYGEDKGRALRMIDLVYLKDKNNQLTDFIDKNLLIKLDGNSVFADKLFDVILEANNKISYAKM